ncbi:MAG: SEC-C metal-binding domain-containing protein [Thermoplasmatota archaeon]
MENQRDDAGTSKKVGRNDPCPCGSGKKYKKCCLQREREMERNEREHIDNLPLHTTSITRQPGSRFILIARKKANGNLAFIAVLVDEWKMGLKDCFGSYNAPQNRVQDIKTRLPHQDASLEACKKLIKRGLQIARTVGTQIPPEFHQFKDIIGGLDDISVEGSLYKCFKCGTGDLHKEEVDLLKHVARKEVQRGVCGTPEELQIILLCDECRNSIPEDDEFGWLDDEVYTTRETYMEDVKKSLQVLSAAEYREILEQEGWATWGPVACMDCGNEHHIEVDIFAVDGDLEPMTPEEESMLHRAVQELSGDPAVDEQSMDHLFIGDYFIVSIPTCSQCGSHHVFSDF